MFRLLVVFCAAFGGTHNRAAASAQRLSCACVRTVLVLVVAAAVVGVALAPALVLVLVPAVAGAAEVALAAAPAAVVATASCSLGWRRLETKLLGGFATHMRACHDLFDACDGLRTVLFVAARSTLAGLGNAEVVLRGLNQKLRSEGFGDSAPELPHFVLGGGPLTRVLVARARGCSGLCHGCCSA